MGHAQTQPDAAEADPGEPGDGEGFPSGLRSRNWWSSARSRKRFRHRPYQGSSGAEPRIALHAPTIQIVPAASSTR